MSAFHLIAAAAAIASLPIKPTTATSSSKELGVFSPPKPIDLPPAVQNYEPNYWVDLASQAMAKGIYDAAYWYWMTVAELAIGSRPVADALRAASHCLERWQSTQR